MKNNDELQYMPMMNGRVGYTNDFKTTNIKNHGVKKGTVKWNHKKFVTTLVLMGSVFTITVGGVHAFKTMNGSPKTETNVVQTVDIQNPIKEEQVERVICDYKVKTGDTLDGIIYDYVDSAREKDYYKNYITNYNGIENDFIKAGQVITLVGVPKDQASKYNTGKNEEFNYNDEISVQLNGAVQELLESENLSEEDVVKGSLMDNILNELNVYNNTTNEKTRSYLAKIMLRQIENERDYGSPTVTPNERRH